MADTQFFSALDQVMNAMIEEADRYVEEHHVTTQKLVNEAARRGIKINSNKAMRLIRNQEEAGALKYGGKRLDRESRKIVHVWEVLETSPPPKAHKERKQPPG
jgi:hypothetical protein